MSAFCWQTSKFWIVVSDASGMTFRPYRHSTEESAFTEAARLSKGSSEAFYVLEAKGACKRVDVITRRFDGTSDDIPF